MDYLSHSPEVSSPSPHHLPPSCPAAHAHAHGPFSRGQLSNPSMLRYNPNPPYDPIHNHPHHYPPIHHHSWGPHTQGGLPWPPLPPISAPSYPHLGHTQQMTQSRMSAPHLPEPYSSPGALQYPTPSPLPPPSHVGLNFSSHPPSHPTHGQPPSSAVGSQHHSQLSGGPYSLQQAPLHPPNLSPASESNQAGTPAGAQAGGQAGAGTGGSIRHSGPPPPPQPIHTQRHSYHSSHNHYQRLSGQYSGPAPPVSQPAQQSHNHLPNSSGPYPFSYERSYPRSYSPPGNNGANNLGAYSSTASTASSLTQGPSMSSPAAGASGQTSSSGPNPTATSASPGSNSTQNRPHSLYTNNGQEHSASLSSSVGGPSNQPPQSSTSTQGYPVPSAAPLSAHPTNNNPRHSFSYHDYIASPYSQPYPDSVPSIQPNLSGAHHHHQHQHHHHHHHHPPPPPPPENRRRVNLGRARRHPAHRASIPDMDSDEEYAPPSEVMELLARDMRGDDSSVRAAQFLRGQVSSKMVASPSAIASLESVPIDSLPENERSCIICYNDFGTDTPEGVNEAPLRLPECKHIFGDHCIKKWFEDSDSCPYCRSKVPSAPRVEINPRALQEYARARAGGRNMAWSASSEEAVLRLLHQNGVTDGPTFGSTGSRRSPPSDVPENRRRIRPRFTGSSSHREGGSSSSSTSTSGSSRPQSFAGPMSHTSSHASPSPPRPAYGGISDRDGPTPPMPMQSRLDRMNTSPTRTRPYSAIHNHGDGYSSLMQQQHQQRVSADLQFGFFSRQPSQQSQPSAPTSLGGRSSMTGSAAPPSDAGLPSASFFSSSVPPMQQQRPVDGNGSVQGGNEDVPMPDIIPGPDSTGRPVPANSL